MTPSELKHNVEISGNEPHFFTKDTMKFFGDTMSNYGVRSATIKTYDDTVVNGKYEIVEIEVWELYRKRPVKHGLSDSTYFCKKTFKRIFERN